ncbi:hypothetical protein HanRHA438_Chr17g0792601 [Helianthus annuus]|nr:hypothetical protein HanRHA438_Chr17g0792601 [Helianthus annuus]
MKNRTHEIKASAHCFIVILNDESVHIKLYYFQIEKVLIYLHYSTICAYSYMFIFRNLYENRYLIVRVLHYLASLRHLCFHFEYLLTF